ncbi:MAG: hypothetical protein AVDCRST_MAG24-552 [uncultured Nocardioidaceae bacterium]|uniref:Uncharacterized protein n=1 Tax=uncultured Nocardioidaceae bacterium TaxID=253824 RepID=A0A6J4L930_9ACTN|nr:MAG: hypothetical protein AVDCRST_MAG24-552 [uncultured Nocardioidaceae bacterium]
MAARPSGPCCCSGVSAAFSSAARPPVPLSRDHVWHWLSASPLVGRVARTRASRTPTSVLPSTGFMRR